MSDEEVKEKKVKKAKAKKGKKVETAADPLDSVLGESEGTSGTATAVAEVEPAADPTELPLDSIVPDEGAARVRTEIVEGEFEALKSNVKEIGIQSALWVAPADENGKYRLLAGYRRFRAATELKLKTVPVVVKDLDDTDIDPYLLGVIENTARADLSELDMLRAIDTIVASDPEGLKTEAKSGARKGELVINVKALAKRLGRGEMQVRRFARALELFGMEWLESIDQRIKADEANKVPDAERVTWGQVLYNSNTPNAQEYKDDLIALLEGRVIEKQGETGEPTEAGAEAGADDVSTPADPELERVQTVFSELFAEFGLRIKFASKPTPDLKKVRMILTIEDNIAIGKSRFTGGAAGEGKFTEVFESFASVLEKVARIGSGSRATSDEVTVRTGLKEALDQGLNKLAQRCAGVE